MKIVEKIKSTVEQMGLPFRYGSAEELNQYSDNTDMPAVFLYRLDSGTFYRDGREQYNIIICFFDKTSFNFWSEESESIREACRVRASDWLNTIQEGSDFNIIGSVNIRPIYLEFASVYTGVSLNFTILGNQAICLS